MAGVWCQEYAGRATRTRNPTSYEYENAPTLVSSKFSEKYIH